jgi:hypothetical protein
LPALSLSKRWNVAKLTSAISSSPSVKACGGVTVNFCGASTAGTAVAEAVPASEKVNPAAPKAGTAALATLFRFEACFTRDIVVPPSNGNNFDSSRGDPTPHDVITQDCAPH